MVDRQTGARTGIFYTKEPPGVLVMLRGVVVERYRTVEELVEAHAKGIEALEASLEAELERQYRPDLD